jgi:hypothetical protein
MFKFKNNKVQGDIHAFAGFAFTVCIITVTFTGMAAFLIREKEWMTLKIVRAGNFHKMLGYLFVAAGFLIVSAGIHEFFEKYGKEEHIYLGLLNLIVTFTVYGIAELTSLRLRLGKDPFTAPDKTMSE